MTDLTAAPPSRAVIFARRLRRLAEVVAALLLAIIFVAFIAQIAFRYLLDWPLGWTNELSVIAWLWLVLWSASFVLREKDEIRFDILSAGAGRRARQVMGLLAAVGLIALYSVSLPAATDYVSFMQVQETSYLDIPFNWCFSIFLIFSVAAVVRYLWLGWQLLRGRDEGETRGNASGI